VEAVVEDGGLGGGVVVRLMFCEFLIEIEFLLACHVILA